LDARNLVHALGINGYYASRTPCQKDRLVELFVQVPCVFLDVGERKNIIRLDVDVVQMRRFEIVRLAVDVLEFVAEVPGVEQNGFVSELFEQRWLRR